MSIPSAVASGAGNDALLMKVRTEVAEQYSSIGHTLHCVGPACFRTQAARDLAYLLDVDRSVRSWRCLPLVLAHRGVAHVPDFLVTRAGGTLLMDAGLPSSQRPLDWCHEAAERVGYRYERHVFDSSLRYRLENARELLAYASHPIQLRERLLLLTCLDDYRSLPLSACIHVLRGSHNPVGVIAAMALRRFVEIDLDEARMGPETRVSRFRD
jgi:hypothetical protein